MATALHAPAPRKGDWMQTFTGRQYWPLDPHPDEVCVRDIAHHLAMLCRYTGACIRFYSVAEHSVHVSHVVERYVRNAPREVVLNALMHDAAEAYCNDIARPVKREIVGYDAIEGANMANIVEALELPGVSPAAGGIIKQADNAMLLAEQATIMAPAPHAWQPVDVPDEMRQIALERMHLAAYGPEAAERLFMGRYRELTA
jgi:hypothetical protein